MEVLAMQRSNQLFLFLNPEAALSAVRVQEGMRVADFHAGAGFFTRAAARRVGTQGRVWAIDADHDRLARLKNIAELEGLEHIEIVHGNIERRGGTLLPDESIDMVLVVNTLFTCEDKEMCAEEAWR